MDQALARRERRPPDRRGSTHLARSRATPRGVPRQIRGVTQDITERVAAAEVHDSLNRHLQLLLQSTAQGIFGIDTDGRCTFINRSAAESLGYSATELIGVVMHDVIHPALDGASSPPDGCPIQIAASTGTATEVQSDSLSRRDGSLLPVEYSVAPILDRGVVAGAVVAFTDVSERMLLQAQLEQSDRVSSLGRLAATMAHEFNNVLMGIQPFAEILSRQNPGEAVQRATQNILQAVQRGRSITHGILRFAKPAELVKETIDVARWLRSMETAMTAVLGEKIRLDLRVDGEALFVRGDRHQLEQVLTNLAANARDAMQGSGTFSLLLARCMSGYVFPFGAIPTSDRYLHLRMSDTGCGMDAKTLKSIFDPFFTTKRSGTGLGLAVVHQVVQLHGGIIVAESILGEGTTFHLFLPFGFADVSEPSVDFWRKAIHPDDRERVLDGLAASIASGEAWSDEYRFRKGDGTYVLISDRALAALDENGKVCRMVGAMVDVTEQRIFESRLEQAQRVATLGQMAANMAHEFNNVLMGIQPFVEVLRRLTTDIPRAQDATGRIAESVKRGKKITDEILRYTRDAEPVMKPIKVRDWLAEFSVQADPVAVAPFPCETPAGREASPVQARARMVLIVDDESVVADGISMLLASEAIHTHAIQRGEEAIDAIENHAPDVVLLDIGLPGISGVEVFRLIHERWPDQRVVLMTGHYGRGELGSILTLPHVRFLQKPFGAEELLKVLQW